MSLSPQTIKIIKATAPVLAEHGYTITSTMYGRMLPNNPKVQELFNPTHQVKLPGDSVARQPLALAQSVLAYAQNIDNLGALGPAVERIAHKHVALHILPEHYPVVGENLLWAIKKVLGDAATPEIMAAWTEGYQVLADIFIDRERELREGQGALPGGWEGWREFVVVKKVSDSSDTTSFHLKPKDGQGILNFLPGQYIGLRVDLPNGMTTQRNYSLSNAPNMGEYRITVKREGPANTGCPMGKVSSYLHDDIKEGDVLNLTVPSGDFFLDIKHDKPIVLLSGGVGITPMASMANFLATKNLPNHVTMINCNRCPQSAALGAELLGLTGGRDNFKVKTIFDSSDLGDAKGFLTKDVLKSYVGNAAADAHYYFCGPPAFMVNVRHILGELGVPAEQVHYEFFGPHDST